MSLRKKAGQILSGAMAAVLLMQSAAMGMPVVNAAQTADTEPKVQAETTGTSYHFSSTKGDDNNDGSLENPFQTLAKIEDLQLRPGDKLLLERGSVFDDQYIHLENVGDISGEPIKIEPYGEGTARPQINANGTGVWNQSYGQQLPSAAHKWNGEVSTAVLLTDVENIEIRGLEITNWVDTEAGGMDFKDPNVPDRTGVAGVAKNRGTLEHIVLDDLYVHKVKGNIINKHMLNGGIYFGCFLPDGVTSNADPIAEDRIPRFDDLVIENCHVENVSRWGIAAAYTAYWNKMQTLKAIPDDICETWGSTGVVMRNNFVKDVGGDGITPMHCFRPVVEYNVCQSAGKYIRTDHFPNGNHRVAAGIWPWKCKDAVFRRNECFDMQNYLHGNNDAQAWDADWADGTLYEYNYSHGNTGGCIMFCGGLAYRSTFRYNISQNDERGMLCVPGNPDAHVYNNTFYIKEGVPIIANDFKDGAANIENNIFYYAGNTPRQENYNPASRNDVFYDNNLYYNFANENALDANGIYIAAGADEILADPGKAPTVAQASNKVYELSEFDGYKLAAGSPAIGAGKIVTDDNGFALGTDFFGVKLNGLREIGAAESEEVVLRIDSEVYTVTTNGINEATENTIAGLEANTTLEEFTENILFDRAASLVVKDGEGTAVTAGGIVKPPMTAELSHGGNTITYSILPDVDASLHSTVYMVTEGEDGNTIYVPSTDKNPSTVEELKQGIETASTATVSVLNGDTEVGQGNLSDGMTLKITAENGTNTTEYAVTIKNEYHWINDYVDAQQGNVWFAQSKDASGSFTNATSYSSQYATWELGETYTVVGAQGEKGQVDSTKHGLICDWRPGAPTPAMAFRAPKSGVISFALKEDEPYLRQGTNTGGTARVDLILNDETTPRQTSGEMSTVGQKAEFETVRIAVRKGDYVRLVSQSSGTPSSPGIFATPIITYLDEEADTTAPTVPTDVVVSDITWNSAKLQWTAATDEVGVEKYEVYNGETLLASVDGATTEVVLADLTGLTEYTLDIYALDAFLNKSEAASVSFTTLAAPENLEEVKQQLADKIAQAQAKIAEGKYTDETVAALEAEITASNELLEGTDLTRAALEQAIADLDAAIIALKEKEEPPVADDTLELKIALRDLYLAAEEKIATGDYTEESVAKVEQEVEKARALVLKQDATKEELEQAIADLDTAVKALAENGAPPVIDDTAELKTRLRDLVAQAQAKIAEGKYTEETVAKAEEEIAKSNALLGAEAPTKAALEQSIQDLTDAINGLKEKGTDPDPGPGPGPGPDPIVEAVAAPAFTSPAGTYAENQNVTISTATAGAAIYYTTNGTEPTASSTKYTEAITVNRKTTIKAIAIKEGMADSEVVTASYLMDRKFPFTDVEQNGLWKHESVKYVWDNSIMNGISGTTLFDPDSPLTRAMFATVLYRMAGEPTIEFEGAFSDVEAGKWYSNAIIWANKQGIVQGMGDGSYGINKNITREQIAKMLYEYAKVAGYDISEAQELSTFTDEDAVSGWAVDYMKWATAVKMITGKPNTDGKTYRMDPKGEATRAECAAMLMRFENKYITW